MARVKQKEMVFFVDFCRFCLNVAVRLVGGCPLRRVVSRGAGVERWLGRLRGVWAADGLVGVRCLLGGDATAVATVAVVVGRATGAAARADSPEEGGGERESGCNPGSGVYVLAHVSLDSVRLDLVVKDAGNNGKHGCGRRRGRGREEEGRDGNKSRHTGAPAAENGGNTEEELKSGRSKGDDVGDRHPLRDVLVNVQRLANVVWEGIF